MKNCIGVSGRLSCMPMAGPFQHIPAKVESSRICLPQEAQGNNNSYSHFHSKYFGVEYSKKSSRTCLPKSPTSASPTSVSIAVVLHSPKHFHGQYICICESHMFPCLPNFCPSRRPCRGAFQPTVVWKVGNVVCYFPILFQAPPGPQFDASLSALSNTRAFHSLRTSCHGAAMGSPL